MDGRVGVWEVKQEGEEIFKRQRDISPKERESLCQEYKFMATPAEKAKKQES